MTLVLLLHKSGAVFYYIAQVSKSTMYCVWLVVMLENKMTYDNIFQAERLSILILRDQTVGIINCFKYLATHRDVMATTQSLRIVKQNRLPM